MRSITPHYPTVIVIFGGTGDLAKTKLFPALLNLYVAGKLPEKFAIVGLSRKELSDAEYQQFVAESIAEMEGSLEPAIVQEFCDRIRYVAGSFGEAEAYERVKETLHEVDDSLGQ